MPDCYRIMAPIGAIACESKQQVSKSHRRVKVRVHEFNVDADDRGQISYQQSRSLIFQSAPRSLAPHLRVLPVFATASTLSHALIPLLPPALIFNSMAIAPSSRAPSPTLSEEEALDLADPLRHLRGSDHPHSQSKSSSDDATLLPEQPHSIQNETISLSFPAGSGKTISNSEPSRPISIKLAVDASPGCGGIAWPAGEVSPLRPISSAARILSLLPFATTKCTMRCSARLMSCPYLSFATSSVHSIRARLTLHDNILSLFSSS